MPPQKSSRPDPNVLDLRQLVAQRRVEAERGRRGWSTKTPSSPRRRPSLANLRRPSAPPRDWTLFGRELLKFAAVLVIVAGVSAITLGVTKLASAKTSVQHDATTGVQALQDGLSAIGQSQPAEAATHFTAAIQSLTAAEKKLDQAAPALFDRTPFVGGQLKTTRILLTQAQQLATVGQRLSAIMPPGGNPQPAVSIQSNGIIQGSIGALTPLLAQRTEFVSIVSQAVKVVDTLETIDPKTVPSNLRERFTTWQRLLNGLVGSGDTLDNLTKVLLALLAPEQPREYLVVFQNNDELRPTGGFPGTFLLVKFEQGTFKILDAPGNGPFALSDEVANKNLPPQPILSIVPFWTFHDANWYLDVPTSAKTMLDFYAQDRGFTPDGVIFLTPGLMEDLLRITGPVRPDKYTVDITAENFVAATEQQVQFGYDKALNNPKQFLIDLVPLMLTKLSQTGGPDALRALALTLKRANQGDILMYSGQTEMQKTISALGWDGVLLPLNGDYLAVVDTNLGGGKTDRKLDEQVRTVVKLDNGILCHEVTITRTNHNVVNDTTIPTTNRSFVRVYAPPDAQFIGVTGTTVPDEKFFFAPASTAKISADLVRNEGQTLYDNINGIRITNESGRKVFGAWSRVEPGQSQTLVFSYTTPAPTSGAWHLDWQHQPGAPLRTWQVVFQVPNPKKVSSTDQAGILSNSNRTVTFSSDSTVNRSFNASYK